MRIAEYLRTANRRLWTVRLKKAQSAYKESTQRDPSSMETQIWKARVAYLKGNEKESLQILEQMLLKNPNSPEALIQKAGYLVKQRNYSEALPLLQRAKECGGASDAMYLHLATCYRKLGQFESAEEAARAAIGVNPKNSLLFYDLGRILALRKDPAGAIKNFVQCIRLNDDYLKAYLTLGAMYRRAGKDDLTVQLFEFGLKKNPNLQPLRDALCNIYAKRGNYAAAGKHAAELARQNGSYEDFFRMAILLVGMQKQPEAEKVFKKLFEMNPDRLAEDIARMAPSGSELALIAQQFLNRAS